MDCAIVCMQFLFSYYKFDLKIIDELKKKQSNKGISIYDMVHVSNAYGFHLKAYYSFFIPKEVPCILFQKHSLGGHYYVLIHKGLFFSKIFDPIYKEKTILNLFLYCIYSRICLLVENSVK